MQNNRFKMGAGTRVYEPSNLYGCVIGKNCVVGAFTEIQTKVVIGDRCKIEAFAFIPTGVTIEDGVFIGPHVCFTNDKYPMAVNPDGSLKTTDDWICGSTLVKTGAAIGANTTILPDVTIGKFAKIGAGAIITKDVPDKKVIIGKW
jgi:acetyltransferase-like isoleucine patch superfamily enzyme